MKTVNPRKRIFVVDDHPLVRSGLCQAIAATADLRVCGEADGWHEALDKIRASTPDLIVLDLNLKDGSGWTLLEQLKADGE
ncbi:MAG: response regulator transcription factor, partial [Verrucomicrobiota bacterium]